MKCDYIGCPNEATTSGHVYGHVKGNEESDRMIPVNACDDHKTIDGFFEDSNQ